jgi:hypothetical protein
VTAPLRQCARPGCPEVVPAYMLCCRAHWHQLPMVLRRAILANYRPGQWKDTAGVSPAYWAALETAIEWWLDHDREQAHA